MENKHYWFRRGCRAKTIFFIWTISLFCCYSYGEELVDCYIDIKDVSVDKKEELIQDCNNKNEKDSDKLFICSKKTGDLKDLEDGYLTCGFKKGDTFECKNDRIEGDKCTKTDKKGNIDDCDKYDKQESIKGTKEGDSDSEKMPCYPENHICNKYNENKYKGYYKLDSSDSESNSFFLYKKNARPESNTSSQNCILNIFSCDFKVKNESPADKNLVLFNTENKYNKEFIANIDANLGDMAFFKYIGSCKYSECKNIEDNILSKPYYYKYANDSSLNDDTIISYFEKNIKAQNIGILCNKYLANCIDIRPSDSIGALYNNNLETNNKTNNISSRTGFYNNIPEVREEHLWFVESPQGVSAICLSVIGINYKKALIPELNSKFNYCSDLNKDMANLKYPNGLDDKNLETPNCYLKNCSDLNDKELEVINSKGKSGKIYCSTYLDIGYCSDLNEDMTNLKYPEGLNIIMEDKNLKIPSCYLKSCIDLTKEELEIINSKGKLGKKYCSEYYWLSNHKGLKYFPKEKPIFCSELESVAGKGKQLKFRYKESKDGGNGIYERKICKTIKNKDDIDVPDLDSDGNCKNFKEEKEYYSYGGGRNKNKDNCYLKNCFSLNKKEREVISNAKFINIGFEIERAFDLNNDKDTKKETDYDSSNIPVYCDNGFLFNNKFPGYEEFDYLNLNIIPCNELKNKYPGFTSLNPIPFSTILDKKHDTTNEYRLCRTSYRPLNNFLDDNDKMNQSRSFFDAMAVIANESGDSVEDKKENLPGFPTSEYKMVKFNNQELKKGFKSSNINSYSNICSYIDNNFLYYNAEISSLKSSELKTNGKLNDSLGKINKESKKLIPEYKTCLDGARTTETLYIKNEKKEVTGFIDSKCTDCLSTDNADQCLYDFNGEDCKKYVSNDYYCKREYCKGDNSKYCLFEDDLKEKLVDCSSYKSAPKETTYFDCELYFNTENDYKDDILSLFKVENNSEVEIIRKACESMLPPKETRDLVESNILYKLVKPNKIDINYNSPLGNKILNDIGDFFGSREYEPGYGYGIKKPGKYDIERYGCAKYNKPGFGYGLYGCKLPDFSSSYISTILHGTMADGEEKPSKAKIKFSKKNSQNNSPIYNILFEMWHNGNSITGINVCSRYPDSIYNNNCGQREGSKYFDNKCITLSEDKTSDILEDSTSNAWIFTESTGSTRFRMSRTNRDVFVFRDFHTYHYCYSNFEDKFTDGASYGVIFGEGVLLSTAPATIVCISFCSPLLSIFFPPGLGPTLYAACFNICVPVTIAVSAALYATIRIEEWLINLQNDLHIPRGYVTSSMCSGDGCENNYHDKGMITKALLTNNDNYVYRFYPRSSDIETDIKNKLENNVKGKDRFFYETTLGADIIKKCNLSNILTNSSGCSEPNNCDYNYRFNILDAKGNAVGTCNDTNKIKDCLDPVLVECIESYGVRFLDEKIDFNDINLNLTLHEGGFLKKFKNGDIVKDSWGTSSNEETRTWVPVDIVYYTKDTQTEEQLRNNPNCKMGFYGDPIGDLARCRGFEINCKDGKDKKICELLINKNPEFKDYRGFYTESQSVKVPLFGSPFFFYTLITPNNTPNLFDPSFFVNAFFRFNNNDEKVAFIANDMTILDFFNPKLVFKYDFNGGNNTSPEYKNVYDSENDYISRINADSLYSPPYILKYKSDMINEVREYSYALQKSYSMDLHKEYIPEVKVYRIKAKDKNDDSNYPLELDNCKNQSAIRCSQGDSFISVDNNVASYKRAPLSLNNFTMKQLTKKQIKDAGFIGGYFLHPRIEVFIGPVENSYSSTKSNFGKTYSLKQGEEDKDKYIKDFGKSDIQGYGINLTRSYCSKLYYDYYEYLDSLEKERKGKNDPYEINRLNKTIMSIENEVRKECDQENGEETEILINESEMFAEKDRVNNENKSIITKETAIVKKYNESYGGFNEVCISDYDIEKIFELRKKYGMKNSTEMPSVIALKDDSNRQRKTKCVLEQSSRKKRECLVADKVYVYCGSESVRLGSNKCKEYLDLNTLQKVWVKTFNCYDNNSVNPIITKDLNNITTSEEIEMLKVCFKGGFNYSGNIQKDSSNVEGGTDFVDSCSCELKPGNIKETKIDLSEYIVREMTPREYGLCVDLEKPSICPAVRYYGVNKEYIDDNLALNKTKEELDAEGNQNYYEQHLWRTEEKQVGIVPSVFYTKTLGHAEFPASTYCSDYEEDCIGGSKIVTGQCSGYWKQNSDRIPKAICTKTKKDNGNFYYEYKLYSDKENESNECIRYSCPKIGYDSENNKILDEKDIESKSSDIFTVSEVNDFIKINETDFTSFINNEETNAESVDKRGSFNGFAIWESNDRKNIKGSNNYKPKDQESGDFAIQVTATECLTGFAPTGSNANIYYPSIYGSKIHNDDLQEKYDYVSIGNVNLKNNLENITLIYKDQNSSAKSIIYSRASQLPVRLCNQKGEWQASNDVYNLLLIDKNNKNNNFYYNNPDNYWFKNLWFSESIKLENLKYCERLVCRELDPNNENIYTKEFIDTNTKDIDPKLVKSVESIKNKTWLQNGGAYWSSTSAPRNSSNLITINSSELTPDKSSIDIVKIYTNKPVEKFVENKYKYVKKVQGICRNEYGYYNRGTSFTGSFIEQIDSIRNKSSDKNTNILFTEIRKENKNMGSIDWYMVNKKNSISPYRMCTSTGLWGGLTNRCFRACEMLDMFRTNINEKLYKDKQNFKDEFFVENHDIYSLNVNYVPDKHKEERFIAMNLRDGELQLTIGGLKYGDYLTGGAQWNRSIVEIYKSSIETEGPKKGMRYIEVEGNCDKSYDVDIEDDLNADPTQYSRSAKGISPKRKCYEDGTWGPVYGNTRCALSKSCSDFPFAIADLAKLIKNCKDNEKLPLIDLNKILSEIYQIRKKEKGAITKNCGLNSDINKDKLYAEDAQLEYDSCRKINTFQAVNSTAEEGEAISYEKIFQYSNIDEERYDNPGYIKIEFDEKPKEDEKNKRSMVCNKSTEQSNYVAGWSFERSDLEKYFIPRTCKLELAFGRFLENIIGDKNKETTFVAVEYLKRLIFVNTSIGKEHYSKESLLQVAYNDINEKYKEELYSDGNGVIDDSYKSISIGNINYMSYQLSAICDNRYFYNEIIGNNYYNKHIVFECSGNTLCKGGKEKKICQFMHHKETGKNLNFVKANACLPKTCGDNIYQPSWSKSYVKDVIGDNYGISDSRKPSLNCIGAKKDSAGNAVESAFVANMPSSFNSGILNSYKGYLSKYGFASNINVECSADRSKEYYGSNPLNADQRETFMTINSKTASNTYDANRYGDLSLNDVVGKDFCSDLAKTKCQKITEAELANGTKFREKYCVKMVCPKTGLKLDVAKNKILTDQTGTDTFSLPGKENDYTFDTVVAIQSLAEDFDYYSSRKSYTSPYPNFKYVQYNNAGIDDGQINGNLCPTNKDKDIQDIYNIGAPADYSYDVYYSNTSKDKPTVSKCFNNLESTDAIKIDSTSCAKDIKDISGVCVKYSKTYNNQSNLITEFSEFSRTIVSYTLPNENDFRIKVARFIVEKILFDNPEYKQSNDMITYIDTDIISKAKEYAKTEATKKFNESSAFCFYNYDKTSKDEYKESNLTEYTVNENKYGNIKFYKHINGRIFGLIPESSNNGCEVKKVCSKRDENGKCSKEEELTGKKYQLKDEFDRVYEAVYKDEFDKLKEKFKQTLASANPPNEFKELFEEYYKIFKMGEFLSVGSNLDLYKSFLSDIVEVGYLVDYERGANEREKFELEKIYGLKFIKFYKILEDSSSAIITPSELSNSKYHCVKIEVKADNNVVQTEITCKEESFLSSYKEYFVNFIGNSKYKNLIDNYNKNFMDGETKCEEIYKDYKNYYDNTYKNKINSNTSNYRNGLYMVMKCEPKGWKILDSVACKSRCTGEAASTGFEELDPEGAGNYEVKVEFKNMRFSDSANITFSAFANSSCINRKYSKSRNFSIKCGNEEGKLSYSTISTVPSRNWWLVEDPWWALGARIRCRTYAIMNYSSSNNKKYSRESYYKDEDRDYKDMVGVEGSKVLYCCPSYDGTNQGGIISCGIVGKTPTEIIYHINNKN